MSIRAKLVVAIVASMVTLALASGALVRAAGERNARVAAEHAVEVAGQAFAAAERADVEKLDAILRALSLHPGLAEAFAARDRARLLAVAAPIFAALKADHGVTHLVFIEPEPRRTAFLRAHRPDRHGDVVDLVTLARAVDTRSMASGKELGATAFALRVVRPWLGKDGELLGYLELGEDVDPFLDRMKAQTGDDYALVVEKRFLDERAWSTLRRGEQDRWGDRPRTVVVDSTTSDEAMLELDRELASVPDRGVLLDERIREGRQVARGIVPIEDGAGRRVGGLFVLHDVTELQASMLSVRRWLFAVFAAAAVALGALLLALVNRLVLRRLEGITAAMQEVSTRLAAGDYDVASPPARWDDEIGRFEALFGRFVRVVAGLLSELTRKAG